MSKGKCSEAEAIGAPTQMALARSTIEVLLVDDHPGDVRLTIEAFSESKVPSNLKVVRDGAEALAYLRHHDSYANSKLPDLILLDLNLPKKDGFEVLAEIKGDERLKKIPVIVFTTSAAEGDIERAYECHANSYVTKPLELDQFLHAVHAIEDFWLSQVKLPSL